VLKHGEATIVRTAPLPNGGYPRPAALVARIGAPSELGYRRTGAGGPRVNAIEPQASGTVPEPLRVLLVDDHALVRSAVRQAISAPDVSVVAEAVTFEDALRQAADHHPDVILVEIGMSGAGGLQFVRDLRRVVPEGKIIVLTTSTNRQDVFDAIRLGAVGYLSKSSSAEGLLRSVRGVRNGDLAMPRWIAARLIRDLVERAAPEHRASDDAVNGLRRLSNRERLVLRLIADGQTDREIAEQLVLSTRTVESHVANILRKLDAKNRAAAGRIWREG
jgi:DNA-binding NarL/FixJ family response regulator